MKEYHKYIIDVDSLFRKFAAARPALKKQQHKRPFINRLSSDFTVKYGANIFAWSHISALLQNSAERKHHDRFYIAIGFARNLCVGSCINSSSQPTIQRFQLRANPPPPRQLTQDKHNNNSHLYNIRWGGWSSGVVVVLVWAPTAAPSALTHKIGNCFDCTTAARNRPHV